MSTEENKAIVGRYVDDLNKKNLAAVDELYDVNYVSHVAGMENLHGPEGMKQYMRTFLNAIPDLHWTIEDLIAEGDKVVSRYRIRGTHKGELMGIAPTGKQLTATGILIRRMVGGKVVEEWAERDMLGLMQQLGAIPSG